MVHFRKITRRACTRNLVKYIILLRIMSALQRRQTRWCIKGGVNREIYLPSKETFYYFIFIIIVNKKIQITTHEN